MTSIRIINIQHTKLWVHFLGTYFMEHFLSNCCCQLAVWTCHTAQSHYNMSSSGQCPLTLIILFSEKLKISNLFFSVEKSFLKETTESSKIFYLLKMKIFKLINYSKKLCQNLPGYYSSKYRRREGLEAILGFKPLGTRAGARVPKQAWRNTYSPQDWPFSSIARVERFTSCFIFFFSFHHLKSKRRPHLPDCKIHLQQPKIYEKYSVQQLDDKFERTRKSQVFR